MTIEPEIEDEFDALIGGAITVGTSPTAVTLIEVWLEVSE